MAARFDALNRLWSTVRDSNHDFRASTDIFPVIDTDKVSKSLELTNHGKDNGQKNKPVKSARSLDEVEQRIVARVEEEKRTSYQVLEDQFHNFSDRLRNLDFEGQFGLIRQANFTSLADFKAEVTVGEDELHGLRRDLRDAEDDLTSFKKRHKLERAAKVTKPGMVFLKWTVLIFLLLIETALNGTFLATGNAQGMLGGVTEAFTFAFLNIGTALLLSYFCVRLLVHRSFFLKLLGFISLLLYIAVALGINLALAHYREVSAAMFSEAGSEVIARLLVNPLGLAELNSWTLFGVGVMFSIFAFIDGCYMTDPYPGFSNVQKRVHKTRENYVDRKGYLIDNLKEIRDVHNEKVEAIIRDLSQRRQESQAIIAHRSRSSSLFIEHQNQLERAANTLLTIYREANRQVRSEPEPKYFSSAYKMDRITPQQHTPDEWNDSELSERIKVAQAELSGQMQKIGVEFEDAVKRYHQLDRLFPEA